MKIIRYGFLLASMLLPSHAKAADLKQGAAVAVPEARSMSSIKGRASVLSGDTLWFPTPGVRVRLVGIASCALPQWAFDPSKERGAQPKPVPCGPFARAWLKRTLGDAVVSCRVVLSATAREVRGRCEVKGRDLGYEIVKVGWARVDGPGGVDPQYAVAERYARSARYGLWATYVLDPGEWQARAVDRTVDRRPVADHNLLRDRHSEFTPVFTDWRHRPRRTDR